MLPDPFRSWEPSVDGAEVGANEVGVDPWTTSRRALFPSASGDSRPTFSEAVRHLQPDKDSMSRRAAGSPRTSRELLWSCLSRVSRSVGII